MKYHKRQIRRIKELNDSFFEVLFQKGDLKFVPGSTVTLYKGPEYPIFIASGIQECYCRLILRTDIFEEYFPKGCTSIKLNLEIENKFPTLMSEESPNFVFDTQTIGAFFSWASTHVGHKCKACYLGDDKIQTDWIKTNHKYIKASDVLKMRKVDNLYVMGSNTNFNGKAKKVLTSCKGNFILG